MKAASASSAVLDQHSSSLSQRRLVQQSRIIETPLPNQYLGIDYNDRQLLRIRFITSQPNHTSQIDGHSIPDFIKQFIIELEQYFKTPLSSFNTQATAATGTAFQHLVWQAISTIPCGETRSYGELAQQLGTAPRAVGGACRANPLPILVPCHRVVSSTGGNGGFLGQPAQQGMSASIKQWLLDHERR